MSAMQHIPQRVLSQYSGRDYSFVEEMQDVAHRPRVLRMATLGLALWLPLLVVPGWEQPFSRPKLIVWAVVVLCGIAGCLSQISTALAHLPFSLPWGIVMWVGSVCWSALVGQFASLNALVLDLTGAGWLVLLIAVRPSARTFSWMMVISGSAVAGIAVLQFFGADLFAVSGWIPATGGNARMRVFATLGNPDFVAAFLTGLLPLTFSLASEKPGVRRWGFGLCVLQGAAIVATGSRAPILGIAAAALWMGWLRVRRVMVVFCVIAASVVLIAATVSPARSITTTSQGRLYIWKVSFPYLGEHWATGSGPGGFGALFPAWEAQYWRGLTENSERKFAGLQEHAHNDYLEILVDYGAVGLFSFLSVLVLFLRTVAKGRHEIDSVLVGASAGVVALAAVAFVDFPLARPAEGFLFWSLIAISCLGTLPSQRPSRKQI